MSIIEAPEQCVKPVLSYQHRHQNYAWSFLKNSGYVVIILQPTYFQMDSLPFILRHVFLFSFKSQKKLHHTCFSS